MIIVDDRERPSGICDALTALNERHEVRRLDVGDYVVNGRVFVERKTAADFLESIADRRIFKQAARLRHGNRWSVLIVEGGSLPGGASVRGVLCSLGRIIDATKDELMAVPGVGEFIAGQVATLKGEDKK